MYLVYQEKVYIYQYESTQIIQSDDWNPLACKDYPCLTLTSCDPIGTFINRIVVTGRLVDVWEMNSQVVFAAERERRFFRIPGSNRAVFLRHMMKRGEGKVPKRPLSRLAALVLSGVLLLTLCSCGDEDFSSLASDASGSSAPEWPSQSALGEWTPFLLKLARKKSFLPSFLRSCRSKARNRYRLPLHRSRLPAGGTAGAFCFGTIPVRRGIQSRPKRKNRQSPPEPIRC